MNNKEWQQSPQRERRRRRRRERRLFFSVTSLFAIGLALGMTGALYAAWVVYPLDETIGSPADFREDFKRDYIYMVSQAYAADGNWERAQGRLDLLADEELEQTVLALLERYLREGRPAAAVRNLARLAERLGAEGTALALFAPTPLTGGGSSLLPAASPTPQETRPPTPTLLPTPSRSPTRTPPPTATAAPVETASPTPLPSFRLIEQEQICRPATAAPRIEVVVVDLFLEEVPGVEVVVTWERGEDRFLTGFKPGESPGYGDFMMSPDVSYRVSIADGSGAVGGLRAESCQEGDVSAGLTSWRLRYEFLG